MEFLDIYDEHGNHIGKEDRSVVHKNALWHKTVHCWLYTKDGGVIFQQRADSKTLYTTASGHISAGESVQEGFGREVFEELGIKIDYKKSKLVQILTWSMDIVRKDGSLFKDRAFANVYIQQFNGKLTDFNFDKTEVSALVKVNAKEAIKILLKEQKEIDGEILTIENSVKKVETKKFTISDFLINPGEIGIIKYGQVLDAILNAVK